MNMEQAQERLKQWEETMEDADTELSQARGSGNRQAIKDAQEVWHWAKAKLDEAAGQVGKLQFGLDSEVSETDEEE